MGKTKRPQTEAQKAGLAKAQASAKSKREARSALLGTFGKRHYASPEAREALRESLLAASLSPNIILERRVDEPEVPPTAEIRPDTQSPPWGLNRTSERPTSAQTGSANDHYDKGAERPTSLRPLHRLRRLRLLHSVRLPNVDRAGYSESLYLDTGADPRLTIMESLAGYEVRVAGSAFTLLIPWTSIASVEVEVERPTPLGPYR